MVKLMNEDAENLSSSLEDTSHPHYEWALRLGKGAFTSLFPSF